MQAKGQHEHTVMDWLSVLLWLLGSFSLVTSEENPDSLLFMPIPFGDLVLSIPGVPGEDYPVYDGVPSTSFSCAGKRTGGLYGDPETQCQIFHICGVSTLQNMDKYSFFCPTGTIFNQEHLICDWWFNFDCTLAESLYIRNEEPPRRKRKSRNKALPRRNKNPTTSPGPLLPTILPPVIHTRLPQQEIQPLDFLNGTTTTTLNISSKIPQRSNTTITSQTPPSTTTAIITSKTTPITATSDIHRANPTSMTTTPPLYDLSMPHITTSSKPSSTTSSYPSTKGHKSSNKKHRKKVKWLRKVRKRVKKGSKSPKRLYKHHPVFGQRIPE